MPNGASKKERAFRLKWPTNKQERRNKKKTTNGKTKAKQPHSVSLLRCSFLPVPIQLKLL